MALKLAISGAAGRMGRAIISLAAGDESLRVVSALEAPGHATIGADAGEMAGVGAIGVAVSDRVEGDVDVLVDFSLPDGTRRCVEACRERNISIVIGTTGLTEGDVARIREAAKSIAIVRAANMSIGANVLFRLARQLGATLDASYDVEIVEAHHRFKIDAPSGTALALKDAVVTGRREAGAGEGSAVCGRSGATGARPAGEIGMHSLRLGDTIGEHSVQFGALGETVTLGHCVHSREAFAAGALRAAKWIAGRPAGLYDMGDVLFGRGR